MIETILQIALAFFISYFIADIIVFFGVKYITRRKKLDK